MSRKKGARYTGYALGEIILIVVGILIALQLDNWNQKRKADNQAETWRAAIVEDLRSTQRNGSSGPPGRSRGTGSRWAS